MIELNYEAFIRTEQRESHAVTVVADPLFQRHLPPHDGVKVVGVLVPQHFFPGLLGHVVEEKDDLEVQRNYED